MNKKTNPEIQYNNPTFVHLSESFNRSKEYKKQVMNIVEDGKSEYQMTDIIDSIQKHLRKSDLQSFFLNHPHRWQELCNVLRAGTTIVDNEYVFNDTDFGPTVYALFLIKDREADIGADLVRQVKSELFENTDLLKYAKERHSLLDAGSHAFEHIAKEKRRSIIEAFIVRGCIDNIPECTYENVDQYLPKLLEKMTEYLAVVFGQPKEHYYEFSKKNSLDELVSTIISSLNNKEYHKYGARRLDLMRIIKSFHAWGNINKITEAYNNGREYANPTNMSTLLKKAGIKLIDYQAMNSDEIMYKGTVQIDDKQYQVQWRSKSMKSILQKLWQTEEYSNQDALRDTLGITIIVPDGTPEQEIAHIIEKCQHLMPNYGYIMKNRNLVPKKLFETIIEKSPPKKRPIYATPGSNKTTNPYLDNFAMSGFNKIGSQSACGIEVQILTESGFNWKKMEDPYYKVRGIIELHSRGEYFITPAQLKTSLENLLGFSGLEAINNALKETEGEGFTPLQNIDELIRFLLKKGDHLHAYKNENDQFLYVYPPHTNAFQKVMRQNTWQRYSA